MAPLCAQRGKGWLRHVVLSVVGIHCFYHCSGPGFAQPPAEPADEAVSLLVAETRSRGRDYLALSVTGEAGCADKPEDLLEELDAWTSEKSHGYFRSRQSVSQRSTYRTLGSDELRQRMNSHWDQGRLLVSCYDAFAWLRTGKRPVHGEPPTAEDVLRSIARVLERPSTEASDVELLQWIGEEYGEDGLQRLLEAVKDPDKDAVEELKEFFSWFRDLFPYYHGACGSCMNETTHFLGVVRPSEVEREDGGAGVSEIYFCQGCNCTTSFPRFRRVRPVLASQRGRCGEYAWLALRLVEALRLPGRWVDNHAGHVWVEALLSPGRWVHIDPCEAAVDEPLLYATGWGRCPSHVLTYQANESGVFIEDVTDRYRPADAEALPQKELSQVKDAIAKALRLLEERQLMLSANAEGKFMGE